LSEEGRKLVTDLQEVIKQAKDLLLSKNEGNLLQDFIWQTQHLSGGDAKLPSAPTDKETAQQHGNQALEGMRTLGTLLISNGQFRKLLNDALTLIRVMAGDAAQNAATRVNPKEEQLAQLDEPAEDNTWHDVPDLSKDNIRSQVKSMYNKQKPVNKGDVEQAATNANNAAEQQPTADGEYNQQSGQAGGQAAAATLKEQASANIPEDTKKRGGEAVKATRKYLASKMPQKRREQTIWRLKKMITEIQGHSDCGCASLLSGQCADCWQTNKRWRHCSILRRRTAATGGICLRLGPGLSKVLILITVYKLLRLTSRYFLFRASRREQRVADKIQDSYRTFCQFHQYRRFVRVLEEHLR
jgi:Family of unknown function (DUF5923)